MAEKRNNALSRAAAAMGRKGGRARVAKGFSMRMPEERREAGHKGGTAPRKTRQE